MPKLRYYLVRYECYNLSKNDYDLLYAERFYQSHRLTHLQYLAIRRKAYALSKEIGKQISADVYDTSITFLKNDRTVTSIVVTAYNHGANYHYFNYYDDGVWYHVAELSNCSVWTGLYK